MPVNKLPRREVLKSMLVGLGALSLPQWVEALTEKGIAVSGSPRGIANVQHWTARFFSGGQLRTVETLCDLIIPATDTPGAKAAMVHRFVDRVLFESDPGPQREFRKGLQWLDRRSRELFGADFADSRQDQQVALLTILSSPQNNSLDNQPGVEFFQAIKSLTITGYYTSEIGIYEELGEGELFFEDYAGCTHPEHKGD